ncbi:MAG: alpha-L-fucosidase, partial [Oscillospiraceae bacterium]|nr:alpha-L-fucosidase [Oscillospiraceae bacterium]
SNYGEICVAWFDMPMTLTQEQSQKIYDTVKELQPNCLINSRLGNGQYDYVSLGDNEIPETLDIPDDVDYNSVDGLKPSPNGLYETAATMNKTWGFSYRDQNWKSAEEIYKYKKHLGSLGINYLLNVGPDGLGRIPLPSIEILSKVAQMEKEDA